MTDTKKPKLSEIRARGWTHSDTRHLLDLVERLGKIIDGLVWRYHDSSGHHGDLEDCHFHKCKEARALLKEIEQ